METSAPTEVPPVDRYAVYKVTTGHPFVGSPAFIDLKLVIGSAEAPKSLRFSNDHGNLFEAEALIVVDLLSPDRPVAVSRLSNLTEAEAWINSTDEDADQPYGALGTSASFGNLWPDYR